MNKMSVTIGVVNKLTWSIVKAHSSDEYISLFEYVVDDTKYFMTSKSLIRPTEKRMFNEYPGAFIVLNDCLLTISREGAMKQVPGKFAYCHTKTMLRNIETIDEIVKSLVKFPTSPVNTITHCKFGDGHHAMGYAHLFATYTSTSSTPQDLGLTGITTQVLTFFEDDEEIPISELRKMEISDLSDELTHLRGQVSRSSLDEIKEVKRNIAALSERVESLLTKIPKHLYISDNLIVSVQDNVGLEFIVSTDTSTDDTGKMAKGLGIKEFSVPYGEPISEDVDYCNYTLTRSDLEYMSENTERYQHSYPVCVKDGIIMSLDPDSVPLPETGYKHPGLADGRPFLVYRHAKKLDKNRFAVTLDLVYIS